jgi:3D (Asp-Asp-Asp) domain-containing protein
VRRRQLFHFAAIATTAGCAAFLTSCETAPRTASRRLPAYEPPIAKSDFQTVRTTAYTHTEADHLEYTNHNALGGTLQAATAGVRRAENVARALPADWPDSASDYRNTQNLQSFLAPHKKTVVTYVKTRHGKKKVVKTIMVRPTIGSAAADWSRWPAGTTFRLLSTGQIYKVDDYGWALAGRNTIDLYMGTRADMNSWGVRNEPIQILRWGDPQGSLQVLSGRQGYKHIRRMTLELQGQDQAAAALE